MIPSPENATLNFPRYQRGIEGDLPESWVIVNLGDFVENEKGKKPKNQQITRDSKYCFPYIDIEAFEKNIIKSYADGINCRFCSVNDFLMVWDGSRSGLVGKGIDGALGSTLVRINFPHILNDYAFYFLKSKYLQINSRAKGSGTPHVDPDLLWSYRFPIPPTNEQHRIVEKIEQLFSELDKGIESLKTAREQLKVYRQALLKHAFEGKLTEQWRNDNAAVIESVAEGLEKLDPVIQPKGGRGPSEGFIEGRSALSVNKPEKKEPDGWQWVPLLRIARQETGHTPSRKHPEYWEKGEINWIGIADARAHHGGIIHDTIQKTNEKGLANSAARLLPAGTVCLSRTASVGYVCVMGESMATSQDFATWSCSEMLEPFFLMYALIAEGDHIRKFGKGTTHTTIYFPEIRALNVCLPPLMEQRKIVDLLTINLERVDRLSLEIHRQLKKSETLRQSILKKAFSGQLVGQDSNDEPASELLKRIVAEKAKIAEQEKSARATAKKTTGKAKSKLK